MLGKPSGDKALTSKRMCLQVITVAQLMFSEKKRWFVLFVLQENM